MFYSTDIYIYIVDKDSICISLFVLNNLAQKRAILFQNILFNVFIKQTNKQNANMQWKPRNEIIGEKIIR
jgi:hypothetical protein